MCVEKIEICVFIIVLMSMSFALFVSSNNFLDDLRVMVALVKAEILLLIFCKLDDL